MSEESIQHKAVNELQGLGLREYEAKCLVALTEMTSGTARDISNRIDVPRTRVYEAVRVLESKGLVEIQHSSPQEFRAIPAQEAIKLLEDRYQSRINSLEQFLASLKQSSGEQEEFSDPEIWSLSDDDAIHTRTESMLKEAEQDVLFLVGHRRVITDRLLECLTQIHSNDIEIVVGAATEQLRERLTSKVPAHVVCESKLQWLHGQHEAYNTVVGRLLLVDDSAALASTVYDRNGQTGEQAVYGNGVSNTLVVIGRRLLSAGLAD